MKELPFFFAVLRKVFIVIGIIGALEVAALTVIFVLVCCSKVCDGDFGGVF